MNQVAYPFRFVAALALSSLFAGASIASAQAYDGDEIRTIDPTTGATVIAYDQGVFDAYGADLAPNEEAPRIEVEMPKLPGDVTAPEEPRGPATRMIESPVVQPVPAPAPRPEAATDDPFTIKSILPIEGSIRYGEWYWDESRAPKTGKLVITVDLDARVISVFRDGHEIGTAVALLGTRKHPTPLGLFPILTKEKDNISEKYNNAPMPWTLRLTWDGIAIHGSPVINGYASHGCIGVPDPFAEKLFTAARRGDKVVITRGQMIGLGDKIIS